MPATTLYPAGTCPTLPGILQEHARLGEQAVQEHARHYPVSILKVQVPLAAIHPTDALHRQGKQAGQGHLTAAGTPEGGGGREQKEVRGMPACRHEGIRVCLKAGGF